MAPVASQTPSRPRGTHHNGDNAPQKASTRLNGGRCRVCGAELAGSKALYCSKYCLQKAYIARHPDARRDAYRRRRAAGYYVTVPCSTCGRKHQAGLTCRWCGGRDVRPCPTCGGEKHRQSKQCLSCSRKDHAARARAAIAARFSDSTCQWCEREMRLVDWHGQRFFHCPGCGWETNGEVAA